MATILQDYQNQETSVDDQGIVRELTQLENIEIADNMEIANLTPLLAVAQNGDLNEQGSKECPICDEMSIQWKQTVDGVHFTCHNNSCDLCACGTLQSKLQIDTALMNIQFNCRLKSNYCVFRYPEDPMDVIQINDKNDSQ